MKAHNRTDIPVGTKAFILSKLYYGVLSKNLENIDVERYYSILYFIHSNNGCTQQIICNNLAIDKTAMVKIINYLIKAGFVERNKNPEDRREQFITLTQKGLKQTEEIVSSFNALDDVMFTGITTAEKNTFMQVLIKVSNSLKELPANTLEFKYTKTEKLTNNK